LGSQHTRELTLARDPLGIKPLYVAEQNGGIAFASELKGILPVPDLKFEIDPIAVHDFLFVRSRQSAPLHLSRHLQFAPRACSQNRTRGGFETARLLATAISQHPCIERVRMDRIVSGNMAGDR
jgi:asparagine synthase (glutamine-hydrolysing)